VKIKILLLGLLLASSTAYAANVDGKWSGSLDTPGGPIQVNYTFKANGPTLTGSTTAPDGSAIPIKNGKIDGNKISFSLELDFGQGPVTFDYTGIVSPTEIKMHSEFMGMPIDFAVKKAA
jgi:hypothetical protein